LFSSTAYHALSKSEVMGLREAKQSKQFEGMTHILWAVNSAQFGGLG